ncbi:hypothetical protein PHLCEN_2v7556 [Hermanssonia centrifuga]|uniref:t-SNARE coiled-coil homology domain-containing protein n=1 Tax=Hermanssonia centrifuga TaxID=98765 RepID=A0A2R6NWR9_9APHY|nr:hypothetical protein PHLCEN_2v7556 [Hermanssonia centrifuga]
MPVSSMSLTTGTMLTQSLRGFSELQGHAIKNQDLLVASGAISLQGSESWSAVDEDIEAARASRGGTVTQDLLTPDMDLRQRDRELSEIAKSIASLAELFKDLSALVIDQGTLLDSVEYNIEQTAVQMSDAVKELDMATRYALFAIRRIIASPSCLLSQSHRYAWTDTRRILAGGNAFSCFYLSSLA